MALTVKPRVQRLLTRAWRMVALLLVAGACSAGARAQTLEPLNDVQQVAAGGYHTCALMNSSEVFCWGLNASGQLGDGSTTDRLRRWPSAGWSG
ncbi:MAG: RCC1 domain-containing protein [Lysobacteraceae bacterium]